MKQELNHAFMPQFIKMRNLYLLAYAMNETNKDIDRKARQETLDENVFYGYDYNSVGDSV